MKYLSLIAILIACADSDPMDTIGQSMKGEFMLVKAVGLEPTDVGGPNLDDPIVIEYIPRTYEAPEFTGRLILRENTFVINAPLPLQSIHIAGGYELLPATTDEPERLRTTWINLGDNRSSARAACCPEYPFAWNENTLKLEFWLSQGIDWTLYWKRAQ